MIRFRFTADPTESIAFAYSPLLEAVLSLHVLLEPKHHPLQHPWVRHARGLAPAVRREIVQLGFAYRHFVPEFLAPWLASPGYRTFEAELADLDDLDETTVALGFLRPLWDHEGRRDAAVLEDEAVRRHAAARAEQDGVDPTAAQLIFEAPQTLLRRFAALLASYWEAAFADEWRRLEPRLAETVAGAGRRIVADGVYAYLTGLSPQLLIDASRHEIRRKVPHEHRVEIAPETRLFLVPSA